MPFMPAVPPNPPAQVAHQNQPAPAVTVKLASPIAPFDPIAAAKTVPASVTAKNPPAVPSGRNSMATRLLQSMQGWFSPCPIKAEVARLITENYDTIPPAREWYEVTSGKEKTNKGERVGLFLKLLEKLPPAPDAKTAEKQMSRLMQAIELIAHAKTTGNADRAALLRTMFKNPWIAPSEHYMSIPRTRRHDTLPNVRVSYATGHFTLIGQNGAIRIQTYEKPDTPLFQKPGANGQSIRLPGDKPTQPVFLATA